VAQTPCNTDTRPADASASPKPTNNQQAQPSWMLSTLYKCRTTSKSKPTDNNTSTYSSASSSLSDTDTAQHQYSTYLINCTGCFHKCNTKRQPKQAKRAANPRIVISPTSSCENNQNTISLEKNLKKVQKNTAKNSKKKNSSLSQTQLLIKFHQFSLKSPGPQSNSNLAGASGSTAMSQRCCLSVSVVPSDKNSNSKNKNKAGVSGIFGVFPTGMNKNQCFRLLANEAINLAEFCLQLRRFHN